MTKAVAAKNWVSSIYSWTDGSHRSYPDTATGYLAAGHYEPGVMPMAVVNPQPATSLSANAYYNWAYYDGVTDFTNWYLIDLVGGAFPHVFELMEGPPGMSLAQPTWTPGATPAQMMAAGYMMLKYKPTGNVTSAPWKVRVYSQEYQTNPGGTGVGPTYFDVTGTISTTSSVSHFVFVDAQNGLSTNAGDINHPLDSIETLFGSAYGVTKAWAGATAVLRGGPTNTATYQLFQPTGNPATTPGGILLAPTYTVGGIICYPSDTSPIGETVTIDISNGPPASAFGMDPTTNDAYIWGLSFTGPTAGSGVASSADYHYVRSDVFNNRVVVGALSCPNVFTGTAPINNSTIFFCGSPDSTSTVRNYISTYGFYETNRVSGGGTTQNSMLWYCFFKTAYTTASFHVSTGRTNANNMEQLKNGNQYSDQRYCSDIPAASTSTGCQTLGGFNTGALTFNNEYHHNLFVSYGPLNAEQGFLINSTGGTSVGTVWMRRNSVVLDTGTNSALDILSSASLGPITFAANAIQYPSGGGAENIIAGVSTTSQTDAQAPSGVFDASYNLTGTYKTNWYGQRGWEIA